MNKAQKQAAQAQLNNEKEVIKRLKGVYSQALTDIDAKIAGLMGRMGTSSRDYQLVYQKALKAQITAILDNMNVGQYESISDYLKLAYEDGFIGTMYDLQSQGIPLVFPIDQKQVTKAIVHNTKLSKPLYKTLGENTDLLNKRIQTELARGFSQNYSYLQIAKNIRNQTTIGINKSLRIARTEAHRITQEATFDAQHEAKDAGADVVKVWDSTFDSRTRPEHRVLDGQIRELDDPFEIGGYKAMYPGGFGVAALDIQCRCVSLTKSRSKLGENGTKWDGETGQLVDISNAESYEEFKEKYKNAAANAPKKEYLTESKLKSKIADADQQLVSLKNEFLSKASVEYDKIIGDFDSFAAQSTLSKEELKELQDLKGQIETLSTQKTEWQSKLDQKHKKALLKKQKDLQGQLDNLTVKTYSGIWKDDVTTADYEFKQASIQKKKDYFNDKLKLATSQAEIDKWNGLLGELEEFEKEGKAYFDVQSALRVTQNNLTNLANGSTLSTSNSPFSNDAYIATRKNNANWFTNANGSVAEADKHYRAKAGDVWSNASDEEKDSIYEYTISYSKFNEPLRGIEYGTNKHLGVGNVDLDMIGVKYKGFKQGQVKKQIEAMTRIIGKSSYNEDMWLQRGCAFQGMDKFFNVDSSDFYGSEQSLASKILGTKPTEYAFMSTGVAKGKGLNVSGSGITLNIYAPRGTKMMYAEPFSAFGNGFGRNWDGKQKQASFGDEAEMILQRETQFRVTKVEKKNNRWYIDMEVIGQNR